MRATPLPPAREPVRETITRTEMEQSAGNFGDALRSIQNLPGLARVPYVSGSLVVRGSSPGDTIVLVDGAPLPLFYHFVGLTSTLPTEAIDRVDFYPSNFSARFGRATGGVVDVALRPPRRRRRLVVSLGVIDAGIYAETPLGDTAGVTAGVRYAWPGLLIGLVLNDPQSYAGYLDYHVIADWRPRPGLVVRAAVFGSTDWVGFLAPIMDASGTQRFSVLIHQHVAQLSARHEIGPGITARAMLAAGWTFFEANGLFLSTAAATVPITGRFEFSHPVARGARLSWGVDAQFTPFEAYFSEWNVAQGRNSGQPPSREFLGASSLFQPGIYVEAEITPVPNLRLVPGLRFDWHRPGQQATLEPRMSARWEPLPGWLVRGGVGLYTQVPRFSEHGLFPLEGVASQLPSSLRYDVNVQRATHMTVGVERQITPWLTLSLDGFYKLLDHTAVSVPTIDLIVAGARASLEGITTDGIGRAYGAEVLLRARNFHGFSGWIAYTLMRAERRDAPGLPWRLFEFDQTHNLTIVASYSFGSGWTASGRFRYVTGRPVSPPSVYFDSTTQMFQMGPSTAPYSVRLPDFHQLDLRIEKRWRFRWGAISAFLEVINVYNQPNAESLQWSPDGAQAVPSGFMLPILPNLGVRGEW